MTDGFAVSRHAPIDGPMPRVRTDRHYVDLMRSPALPTPWLTIALEAVAGGALLGLGVFLTCLL